MESSEESENLHNCRLSPDVPFCGRHHAFKSDARWCKKCQKTIFRFRWLKTICWGEAGWKLLLLMHNIGQTNHSYYFSFVSLMTANEHFCQKQQQFWAFLFLQPAVSWLFWKLFMQYLDGGVENWSGCVSTPPSPTISNIQLWNMQSCRNIKCHEKSMICALTAAAAALFTRLTVIL